MSEVLDSRAEVCYVHGVGVIERRKGTDMASRHVVAETDDGTQVLVIIYGDPESELHIALRADPGEVWGPPLEIKADEWNA